MNHPVIIIQLTFIFLQVPLPKFFSYFRFPPAGALLSAKLVPSVAMFCPSVLLLGAFGLAYVTCPLISTANQVIQNVKPYVSPSESDLAVRSSKSASYSDAAIECCEYISYCFNY
jgi:hypothetical protein